MKCDLLGVWETVSPDDEYGDVRTEFLPHGGLVYTIRGQDRCQIVMLIYRVEDDVLVTNQPSHNQEERTKFHIDRDGTLTLRYTNRTSVYRRTD